MTAGFSRSRLLPALLAPIAFVWGACSEQRVDRPQRVSDPLLEARIKKDESFKSGPNSPIPEADRPRFKGLRYFDPDPKYRFQARLQRYPRPEQIRMLTNTVEVRQGLKYGYFEFDIQGQKCRIQVYRMTDDETGTPYLFIPFRDATSGRETYGGGRYLDLEENTSGLYSLDFNLAYNPSCVYGKEFSCPLPPRENTLPVPILAGEKNYALQE